MSTRGESQWVKNVRANPQVSIATKAGTVHYVAAQTPVQDRRTILDAYKVKAGKVVQGYFAETARPRRPSGIRAAHRVVGLGVAVGPTAGFNLPLVTLLRW